jgi:phosphatidylinositol alpha 1,6-mannosyltransferase
VSSPCFVAIGDSFTAGVEPAAPPFPDLVAAQLTGWRYANLAVAGARARDVRAGQLDFALALRPGLVSVICGANDVVRTTRPDVELFAADFNEILLRLRSALPEVSIVTATYPVAEFLPLRDRTRARITGGLNEVNTIVRRSSARHDAVCLELACHPGRGERINYAADGFHPSAAGHRNAAVVFAACLRDRLGIELEYRAEEAAA